MHLQIVYEFFFINNTLCYGPSIIPLHNMLTFSKFTLYFQSNFLSCCATKEYYTTHNTQQPSSFSFLFYFLLVWMIRILNTISKMLKRTKNSACLYFHELPVKTIFETFFLLPFFSSFFCCMLLGAVQCLVYSVYNSVRTDKTIFIESINVGRDLGWNIIYYVL